MNSLNPQYINSLEIIVKNKKWDIIYIGNEYGSDNRTSSHHIAKRLAENHNLLYVEASGLRKPRATGSDLKKIITRIKKIFSPIRLLEPGLRVRSLFILPFPYIPFIPWVNKFFTLFTIKRAAKKCGLSNDIVIWCTVPTLAGIIQELSPKITVYYCVDDFSALPDVDVNHILYLDETLSKNANIIFTPSIPMYEKKRKLYDNVHLSPHGVDVEHFSKASLAGDIPCEMRDFKTPIIGFFGLIEYWIDIELVCKVARVYPDYTIVMIGRITVNLELFDIPTNVKFIGQKPYELLPNYARGFDVAIIPYVLNEQVFNSNPLKLREYLATGKPIVSVSCPEIDKFSHVVNIAKSDDEFIQFVGDAIKGQTYSTAENRINSIASETWEARYEKICSIVEKI